MGVWQKMMEQLSYEGTGSKPNLLDEIIGRPLVPLAKLFGFVGGPENQKLLWGMNSLEKTKLRPMDYDKNNKLDWVTQINDLPDILYSGEKLKEIDLGKIKNNGYIRLKSGYINKPSSQDLYKKSKTDYIENIVTGNKTKLENILESGSNNRFIGKDDKGYFFSTFDIYDYGGKGSVATKYLPPISSATKLAMDKPFNIYNKIYFTPKEERGKLKVPDSIDTREAKVYYKDPRFLPPLKQEMGMKIPKEKYGGNKW